MEGPFEKTHCLVTRKTKLTTGKNEVGSEASGTKMFIRGRGGGGGGPTPGRGGSLEVIKTQKKKEKEE